MDAPNFVFSAKMSLLTLSLCNIEDFSQTMNHIQYIMGSEVHEMVHRAAISFLSCRPWPTSSSSSSSTWKCCSSSGGVTTSGISISHKFWGRNSLPSTFNFVLVLLSRPRTFLVSDSDLLLQQRLVDDRPAEPSPGPSDYPQHPAGQQPRIQRLLHLRLYRIETTHPPLWTALPRQPLPSESQYHPSRDSLLPLRPRGTFILTKVLLLFLQSRLGSRFFVPKRFQPNYFNYKQKIHLN